MPLHPALVAGNVAVITGGADGIGLAAARYFTSLDMKVCLADLDEAKLTAAAKTLGDNTMAVVTDVSDISQVEALKEAVYINYGRVDVLMNNAGTAQPSDSWNNYGAWQTTLATNLWGVLNGIHTFVPSMITQGTPAVVINTGSKQGITTPPGNPAYNVSKSAVKATTESLQHNLRNTPDCQVSAHLLVPGFTYTGMIQKFIPEKPPGAWTPDQVVQYMVESLGRGDFYILCPDNDCTREIDNKRMDWAMGDLTENRPALSRWHPEYQDLFEAHMEK